MKRKVALLSMDNLQRFKCYDKLLIAPMKKNGWLASEISWRDKSVNWNSFDAVIVRSTWDYQSAPGKFVNVLTKINDSSAHLENDLETMKWNMNKYYLHDLTDKNILTVETIWEREFILEKIINYFSLLNTNEIVIKPNISASAENTFRIKSDEIIKKLKKLETIFSNREFMIQPFMSNIISEGEYSLFYFNGQYSHAILKTPKPKDFRVQEEHGGKIVSVNPEPSLKNETENILSKLSSTPLYARVDFVRTSSDDFALMELELIEPSLYFNLDEKSAERFVNAFIERMNSL
ncbi:MAG: hypothetical protein IPJ03_09775 [Ignavibacteriales bacterium]|nr:hypothetical protein [Ignavibacteriales bacterium]